MQLLLYLHLSIILICTVPVNITSAYVISQRRDEEERSGVCFCCLCFILYKQKWTRVGAG